MRKRRTSSGKIFAGKYIYRPSIELFDIWQRFIYQWASFEVFGCVRWTVFRNKNKRNVAVRFSFQVSINLRVVQNFADK